MVVGGFGGRVLLVGVQASHILRYKLVDQRISSLKLDSSGSSVGWCHIGGATAEKYGENRPFGVFPGFVDRFSVFDAHHDYTFGYKSFAHCRSQSVE